jgi:hypothetical protein
MGLKGFFQFSTLWCSPDAASSSSNSMQQCSSGKSWVRVPQQAQARGGQHNCAFHVAGGAALSYRCTARGTQQAQHAGSTQLLPSILLLQ